MYSLDRLNIQLHASAPASITELGAKMTTLKSGARAAILPETVEVLSATNTQFTVENAVQPVPATLHKALPFRAEYSIASSREVLEFAQRGVCGLVLGVDGRFHPVGDLDNNFLTTSVRLVACPPQVGLEEHLGANFNLFNPRPDGKVIVPLSGEIYIDGRSLSWAELQQLGLEILRSPTGAELRYLALQMPGRSVLIPSRAALGLEDYRPGTPYAWQFKGGGVRRYVLHSLETVNGEPVLSHPDDVVLLGSDARLIPRLWFGQRECYAGRPGIFLDVPHGPDARAPEGGYVRGALSVSNHRKLVAAGAQTGRVPVATAKLISPDERRKLGLTSMIVDELCVPCEAWITPISTLRVKSVLWNFDVYSPPAERLEITKSRISMVVTTERGHGSDPYEETVAMLQRAMRQSGKNIRATLDAGLTVPLEWDFAANLTWDWLPLDFGDYVPCWWGQFGSLICSYVFTIDRFAEGLGIVPSTYWRTEDFAMTFFGEFLSPESAKQMVLFTQQQFRALGDTSPSSGAAEYRLALDEIGSRTVAMWMLERASVYPAKGKEYTLDARNLLEFLQPLVSPVHASQHASIAAALNADPAKTLEFAESVLVPYFTVVARVCMASWDERPHFTEAPVTQTRR
ncbi:MAG: hypothetical protein IT290_01115 [Deltaproteobacteria bacterium]|nr:hypothetical protein [Deltaproteobacteria bacterium]